MVEGRGQDLKRLKRFVGMNDSNKETQEWEKEWRELNYSKLAIACQHTDKINDGQECLDK